MTDFPVAAQSRQAASIGERNGARLRISDGKRNSIRLTTARHAGEMMGSAFECAAHCSVARRSASCHGRSSRTSEKPNSDRARRTLSGETPAPNWYKNEDGTKSERPFGSGGAAAALIASAAGAHAAMHSAQLMQRCSRISGAFGARRTRNA